MVAILLAPRNRIILSHVGNHFYNRGMTGSVSLAKG
jgi:hypothetical protein